MTRSNERRARELLLAASKDWEERSFEAGVGTVIKALDEAEARERERCAKLVERERKFTGFEPGAHSALKRAAAEIRKPPTPTTEEG